MRRRALNLVVALVASMLSTVGLAQPTLVVVGGELQGAKNVSVDGTLYDVEFLDGSCIELFDGCDEVSDFTFQTTRMVELASHALIETVFINGPSGLFDDNPSLTRGCIPGESLCYIFTVYWVHNFVHSTGQLYVAGHASIEFLDDVLPWAWDPKYKTRSSAGEKYTWARWTASQR